MIYFIARSAPARRACITVCPEGILYRAKRARPEGMHYGVPEAGEGERN